jgi:hypothetical protein
MDAKQVEPANAVSEPGHPSGSEPGAISPLPTPTSATVSGKHYDVVEPQGDLGSPTGATNGSRKEESLKEQPNENPAEPSQEAINEGEKTVSDRKLESQSAPNPSTVASVSVNTTPDAKIEAHKEEDIKGGSKEIPVNVSQDVAGGGLKALADYVSELQSMSNPSAAGPSSRAGMEDILPNDLTAVGEEEDDSVAGSLDVCRIISCFVYRKNINLSRWTRTKQTLLLEI